MAIINSNSCKALEKLRTRLLDLTTRNRLLNYRFSKTDSLRIIDELPDQITEHLLNDIEMRFIPVSEPTKELLIRNGYIDIDNNTGQEICIKKDPTAEEWAKILGLNPSYEVPRATSVGIPSDKHSDRSIQALLFPYELETRLRNIYTKAETAIEESGANILYLSIGYLEWSEYQNSDKKNMAPLYLIPVKLHKGRINQKTGTYEYTLSYSGEDILPNLSLREKLKNDFGLALPELVDEETPESYLDKILRLINYNKPEWKIRHFITLSLLNFNKLLLYLDLDSERWPEQALIEHPIVRLLLSDTSNNKSTDNTAENGFGKEYDIDDMSDVHELYPLINDADSSQHSALIDVISGKNMVIEGPPGTGKSQTITNLIAAGMSQGKKILFIAEKLAALEVVKHRLDKAGLGEYCLELHSHKSQKNRVLSEIKDRLQKKGCRRKPGQISADIKQHEEAKEQLKSHVKRINSLWKNTDKTCHEILMKATYCRESLGVDPERLHPSGINGEIFNSVVQRQSYDQAMTYARLYRNIEEQIGNDVNIQSHPWFGVRNTRLQLFDKEKVCVALDNWQKVLMKTASIRCEIAQLLCCEEIQIPNNIEGLKILSLDLSKLPVLNGNEILDVISNLKGDNIERMNQYLKTFEEIQGNYKTLSEKVSRAVLNDISIIPELVNSARMLTAIIGQNLTISSLQDEIHRLDILCEILPEMQELSLRLAQELGEIGKRYLSFHEAGLKDIKNIIEFVISLAPDLWNGRDKFYDNEELDRYLPQIKEEMIKLKETEMQLGKYFNINQLESQVDLENIHNEISNAGVFKWFSSAWRAAKTKLIMLRSDKHVKFKSLVDQMECAIRFINDKKAFEAGPKISLLGDMYKGLGTDIDRMIRLREWYHQVRKHYGIGFGQKVDIGKAILTLPDELARAIRSIADQEYIEKIVTILNSIKHIRLVFRHVHQVNDEKASLDVNGGLITQINNNLKEALKPCEPLLTDNNINLKELIDLIGSLHRHWKEVAKWKNENLDNILFQGKIGLKLGVDVDNTERLDLANNTLKFACLLDRELSSSILVNRIMNEPKHDTINQLMNGGAKLSKVLQEYHTGETIFVDMVRLDEKAWLNECDRKIESIIARNNNALHNQNYLSNWLDYARVREQLSLMGLLSLINSVEGKVISIDCVEMGYYLGIYDYLAREILQEMPGLALFSGRNQEAIQQQFKNYDNKLKGLQCELIAWKIDQVAVPKGNAVGRVGDFTEKALIEHECGKKSRHIPIRQLLIRAGKALINLKPCFMMGPMSVAQYLEPGKMEFDIIVMDEASQVKPEDALGVIARGKQLIVVGDSKQLPPTSFFDKLIGDDEDDPEDNVAIESSESILDVTIPLFNKRRLRWHYRSRHESLISFSNYSFYDNDLVLFPSPNNNSSHYGIQFIRVQQGCFVNRRNHEEANEIAKVLKDKLIAYPDDSFGLVAMSSEQRDQIERAVEYLSKEDGIFREMLENDRQKAEPLFIKNLENVQGDERDNILISMTYGPQEPGGKVMQRFGPINTDYGWRRLNVLFTRSRKRMMVLSSMGAADIVISGSSKRGVKALRDFLEYAESGKMNQRDYNSSRGPDSDFEVAVASALAKEGFECDAQVGVAGYFIDIAVRDPKYPSKYLMGIECDGAMYHSAKSVRDRDRLRQTILESLGWKIRRIWSTDWYKNPKAELQPIIQELYKIKSIQPVPSATDQADEPSLTLSTGHDISPDIEFINNTEGLKPKLIRFDKEVIQVEQSHTQENRKLLRSAMVEALVEFCPKNRWEYMEYIPSYLRNSIEENESVYIDRVLKIIEHSKNNDKYDLT